VIEDDARLLNLGLLGAELLFGVCVCNNGIIST
jgi:hypothetical protein